MTVINKNFVRGIGDSFILLNNYKLRVISIGFVTGKSYEFQRERERGTPV